MTDVRAVVTPEGVPLRFVLADWGDRAGAFLIDFAFIVVGLVLSEIVFAFVGLGGLAVAGGLVVTFLLRSFYFSWFECRWQGATPGKAALGLRVIDAAGGALTTDAVVVRNVMREVEFFIPLAVLIAPEVVLPEMPWWGRLLSVGWLAVLAAMPLLNRDRLRVGDLVAGTLVVAAPRTSLLLDASSTRASDAPSRTFAFASDQLDLYGIYELEVLERILRRPPARASLRAVADTICAKIGWAEPLAPMDVEPFLRAFYAAQRGRLEERMLLRDRRERKRVGRRAATR